MLTKSSPSTGIAPIDNRSILYTKPGIFTEQNLGERVSRILGEEELKSQVKEIVEAALKAEKENTPPSPLELERERVVARIREIREMEQDFEARAKISGKIGRPAEIYEIPKLTEELEEIDRAILGLPPKQKTPIIHHHTTIENTDESGPGLLGLGLAALGGGLIANMFDE